MGMGPVPATLKLLERLDLTLDDIDIIELNEAFASQSLACARELGLADDDPRINPLGGAIALGHPLGMSGCPSGDYSRSSTSAPWFRNGAVCYVCGGRSGSRHGDRESLNESSDSNGY